MAGQNIYWDQVSLLIQIGLLDLAKLPAGAEQPRSSRSKKTTRHIFRSRARWRSDLRADALGLARATSIAARVSSPPLTRNRCVYCVPRRTDLRYCDCNPRDLSCL